MTIRFYSEESVPVEMHAVDRLKWLYDNRELVGGLTFIEQPKELRFYFGKLKPTSKWQEYLVKKFKEDFGDSL